MPAFVNALAVRLEEAVPGQVEVIEYLPLVLLGVICALVGILIMRGVTLTETLFRRSGVPWQVAGLERSAP